MTDARVTKGQRKQVYDRANLRCEYCFSPVRYAVQSLSVEHINPRAKGGHTKLDNLALACQGCNNHKYTKTQAIDPTTGKSVPLYHPRQHQWHQHFTWGEDFLFIQGLTPIGRATVEVLHLNRKGVVNLRRLLKLAGEHPPEHT